MKKSVALWILALVSGVIAGCVAGDASLVDPGFQGTAQKASAPAGSPDLQGWLDRNKLEITAGPNGRQDHRRAFAQGVVVAYGEGRPSREAAHPAKKRLTALRAAEVDAQRNLALFFAGQAEGGEVRFRNYTIRLEALLKGAVTVAEEYDQESEKGAVLVRLDLAGAKGFAR